MKITCLAENTAFCEQFGCEHGLSLFIETNGHKILFDMGQTGLFAENAEKLGVNLASADLAVLSHGHYDHGGGLELFLSLNQTAPVYVSPHAFAPHYHGTEKYIGLDPALLAHPRLVFTAKSTTIADGVTLFPCPTAEKKYELGSFGLTVRRDDGTFAADDFRHEQYMLAEEDGHRILITGCSHWGVLDLVRIFHPDVLVGGFHFSKILPGDDLETYARILDSYNTEYYTCHCTGVEQFEFMKDRMHRLHSISSGQTLDV